MELEDIPLTELSEIKSLLEEIRRDIFKLTVRYDQDEDRNIEMHSVYLRIKKEHEFKKKFTQPTLSHGAKFLTYSDVSGTEFDNYRNHDGGDDGESDSSGIETTSCITANLFRQCCACFFIK